jgi:predicted DNA-binding WGR domain protein
MIVTLYRTGADGVLLYYTIHDRQASLTQPHSLTVAWSRGNGKGRERFYAFGSLAEKDRMIRALLASRFKAGYRLLYSFSRDSTWRGKEEGLPPRETRGQKAR